jgi:hypothetical protein
MTFGKPLRPSATIFIDLIPYYAFVAHPIVDTLDRFSGIALRFFSAAVNDLDLHSGLGASGRKPVHIRACV